MSEQNKVIEYFSDEDDGTEYRYKMVSTIHEDGSVSAEHQLIDIIYHNTGTTNESH